jgi:hypothetical protein
MYATGSVECFCPMLDSPSFTEELQKNNLCCYDFTVKGNQGTLFQDIQLISRIEKNPISLLTILRIMAESKYPKIPKPTNPKSAGKAAPKPAAKPAAPKPAARHRLRCPRLRRARRNRR